jgi:glycosyltransferase involved in cell wall biosynthesis
MVGTIEPRKGHAFALDAFEYLWRQENDYRLIIIGKIGWNIEPLERRIKTHPELGNRLFFIEDATDAEVNVCYSAGTALVAPSIAEGFGLPIVEAALYEVPTLASDIPVFREIGGEGAVYFSLDSSIHLAEAAKAMAARSNEERSALAKKVKYLSWKESAEALKNILECNP